MTGPINRSLANAPQALFDEFAEIRRAIKPQPVLAEIGRVTQVGEGVAHVTGFSELLVDELLAMPGGLMGIASTIRKESVGAVLLGDSERLKAGAQARRTKRVVDAPVGEGLLGRIVDGLGRPIDGGGPIREAARGPLERPAPASMDRAPVTTPHQTGVKSVDAANPIGRGQREHIVG
ncbi:MAG: F0F1 ATP synthase subunit alpha, partial [Amphiplicatus sp.]